MKHSRAMALVAFAATITCGTAARAACVDKMHALSKRIAGNSGKSSVAWQSAPSGDVVAIEEPGRRGRIAVWRSDWRRPRRIREHIDWLDWSPDGSVLWFLTKDERVGRFMVNGARTETTQLQVRTGEQAHHVVAVDGTHAWVLVSRKLPNACDICRVTLGPRDKAIECRRLPSSFDSPSLLAVAGGVVFMRDDNGILWRVTWPKGEGVDVKEVSFPDRRVWGASWLAKAEKLIVVSFADEERVPRATAITISGETVWSGLGALTCRSDPQFAISTLVVGRELTVGDEYCVELSGSPLLGGSLPGLLIQATPSSISCFE